MMPALATAAVWFVEHGLGPGLAVTVVLAAGLLCVLFARSVVERHRLARLTLGATGLTVLFALLPLPRWDWQSFSRAPTPVSSSVPPALPDAPAEPRIEKSPRRERAALRHAAGSSALSGLVGTENTPPARVLDTESPAPKTDSSLWILGLLAAGSLLFTLQLLLGLWHLGRALRRTLPAPLELRSLAPLSRRTRLRISSEASRPFCVALLWPVIVLPKRLARPSAATRYVLRHEWGHIETGDARARALCALLRPLLFWHPLYWCLAHELHRTGELLADDSAATGPGGTVAEYVRCMLQLTAMPDRNADAAWAAPVFRRPTELTKRLEMIMKRENPLPRSDSRVRRSTRIAGAALLITVTVASFGVAPARAQEPAPQSQANELRELRAEITRLRAQLAILELERVTRDVSADRGTLGQLLQDPNFAKEHEKLVESIRQILGELRPPQDSNSETRRYVVKEGDSLAKLAIDFYGSAKELPRLLAANPGLDATKLRVGQVLAIPGPDSARAAKSDDEKPESPAALPTQPSKPSAEASHTPSLSELATLVERCLELRGEVEIQKLRLASEKSAIESKIAEIRLQTKQKQYASLRSMLELQLKGAELRYQQVKALHQKGYVSSRELMQAEAILQLLKSAR